MVFGGSITFADETIGRAIGGVHVSGPRDEDAFLDALRAGEAAAFDTLVEMYSGDVYALLFRLTSDPEEARDLSQDTFLRALRSVKGFRGDASLKTWLFRIAVNESRNRFRWWKRRRRDVTMSLDVSLGSSEMTLHDTLADGGPSPEESTLASEREARLTEALAELKDVYREAVVLCDIEGLSYEETAAALGTNIGTVKSRISRGRDELRRRLRDL